MSSVILLLLPSTYGNKHWTPGQTAFFGAVIDCYTTGVLVHRHVHHYPIAAVLVDQKVGDMKKATNGVAQATYRPHTYSSLLIHTHTYPGVQHRKGYFDKLQVKGSLILIWDSLKTTINPSFLRCLDCLLPWKISMVVLRVVLSCMCFLLIS